MKTRYHHHDLKQIFSAFCSYMFSSEIAVQASFASKILALEHNSYFSRNNFQEEFRERDKKHVFKN